MADHDRLTSTSADIMSRLIAAAQKSERGQRTIGTLTRLKIACDDIASGAAAKYALAAKVDTVQFDGPSPKINSVTIGSYVKIRRQCNGGKGWTGPHASTVRSNADFKLYVDARQIEANGSLVRRRPKSKRAEDINAIVSRISEDSDRLLMINTIEKWREDEHKLQIVSAAVPKLWGIDMDAIVSGSELQAPITGDRALGEQDLSVIRQLVSRITDNRELREFGLVVENDRVKAMVGTGATLISKSELALLRRLAG